jgi:formamidase
VVDIPNACCSLYLPTAMFDFDIRPNADGPQSADRGSAAKSTGGEPAERTTAQE